AHRIPFAADGVDVRRRRARQDGARRLPNARAERPPGRTVRSRRAAPLPRLQGVRLLYRPHPVRRRRLHRGLIMAAKARIAVLGAGLMGHGIAQVFALAGHEVTITDAVKANLDTAKPRIAANLRDLGDDAAAVERVRPCAGLAGAVRDAAYVVEAVSEDLALKQKLFAEVEGYVRPDTILA